MSAIDEGIVREYFEQNGFFVRQARKYSVTARKKTGEEEIDLLVSNPAWLRGGREPDFFLFASELPVIQRAVVSVKQWHTNVFTPNILKSSPEIFGFLEQNVLKQLPRFFEADAPGNEAGARVTKILVLPALPTAEPFRSQSVALLKERGVDAIISLTGFSMVGGPDYDLIKDTQLELPVGREPTARKLRAEILK